VSENELYECPECGSTIHEDIESCPNCGITIDWDEPDKDSMSAVDKILEEIDDTGESNEIPESHEEPGETIEKPLDDEPEADEPETDGYQPEDTDGRTEREEALASEEDLEGVEEREDEEPTPVEPMEVDLSKKHLYAGFLSRVGILFIVLLVIALSGTIVLVNYDTWVSGADTNRIGDYQWNFLLMGIIGIVVSAIVVLFDVIRNRRSTSV
jgi:hypothetical protein